MIISGILDEQTREEVSIIEQKKNDNGPLSNILWFSEHNFRLKRIFGKLFSLTKIIVSFKKNDLGPSGL